MLPEHHIIRSNGVMNLSPEKAHVFREAFRVLTPGGRLAVSDVVATAPFPDEVQRDVALRAGCVAGASLIDHLEGMLRDAGFVDRRMQPKNESRTCIRAWVPGTPMADDLISATSEGIKPERA
jgi:arsenite methyltransferase